MPGSVTRPAPGYQVSIVDDTNKLITEPGTLGRVVIKLPMPPSFMTTLWGNEQAFIQKYLSDTPGYFTSGDAGFLDKHGYLHIMTRIDDVINTAGHRFSTGRLEEVINEHSSVVESAVVGWVDEIRGECPLAYVILKDTAKINNKKEHMQLFKEVNDKVRTDVGPIARIEGVIICQKLPKTRSGKIIRGVIKKIANSEEFKMPATIDDVSTLKHIKELTSNWLEEKK